MEGQDSAHGWEYMRGLFNDGEGLFKEKVPQWILFWLDEKDIEVGIRDTR